MVVGLSLCVGCKTSQVRVSAFLHGSLSLCSYVVPKLDKIIPGLAGLSWSESLWIPLVVKHGHEHLPFIDFPLKYPSMRSMREFPLLFDYQRVHIAVFCPYPECGSKTASRRIPSPSSWGVKWMSPKRTGGIAKHTSNVFAQWGAAELPSYVPFLCDIIRAGRSCCCCWWWWSSSSSSPFFLGNNSGQYLDTLDKVSYLWD